MTITPPATTPKDPVLERILLEARQFSSSGRKFLAVFDLDSTLLDLTLRISAIVDDFAAQPEYRALYPTECERLCKIEILKKDWGLNESLERLGFAQGSHSAFWKDIHDHWAKCFFSNEFLDRDEPLPGAVEFVRAVQAEGAEILYLTGRDTLRMSKGTEASLKNRGFPLDGVGAKLVLKPDAALDDAAFKVEVLQDLENRYERIWLFENEPVNLNRVAEKCPNVGLVFIETTHSRREEVCETLARIQHFEVNLKALTHFHKT